MKKSLLSFIWLTALILPQILAAQVRTVTGKVTAKEDGSALPGVNVIIKGTTNGTVTDVDGNYNVEVPGENTILVFTYIGLTSQELSVGTQSVIDVVMSANVTELGEIVVTAVGIQREARSLGYSVESITGNKIDQASEPDALRALQGKVPGVDILSSSGAPGSATRVTIRGNSSLLGNNEPLFVVDGIPFNNDENRTFNQLADGGAYSSRIADLDPNNIQSISVLKGAAAAALYGSRAANGVILITTKSGNPKATNKGLEMTFGSSYAWETIANLPEFQNTYGSGVNFAYQQVNGSWGAPFVGTRPYATVDSIPHWYAGRPGMEAFNNVMIPYRAYPDNVKDLFRTGGVFDNSINISTGNEKSALSITVSNTNNNGYVPNTQFERTNISAGGTAQLDNKFQVGANLSYIRSRQNGVQSGVGSLGSNNQSAFARALFLGRDWDVAGQPYQNPVDMGSEFMISRAQADNPFWSYKNAGFTSNVNRIVASASLGYDVFDWLNLSYKVGINSYNQRDKDFIRPGSTGASGLGRLTLDNTDFEEIESNFLVTVTKNFSQDFTFKGILGHNVNQRTTNRQAVQGTQYVVFDIDDLDNMTSVVPFGGDYQQRRLFGVFGSFDFGYKDWAYLTITGRNDWSSTLPLDHNSFFYPAITGSLILTDALGMNSDFLRFLKVRGGWSKVGNDTDPYQLRPVYLVNDFYETNPYPTAQLPFTPTGGTTTPSATLDNIERNPELKPESTSEVEAGFDSRLLSDRVSLNVTVYKRISKDQIAGVSLPDESGFTFLFTNFGEVSNKGIEIGLGITPIKSPGGFSWDIYGTFTHNKNVVEKLRNGVDEIVIEPGSSFAGSVV
jgi:TonB-linked SusC/RagA family outer membrane protein